MKNANLVNTAWGMQDISGTVPAKKQRTLNPNVPSTPSALAQANKVPLPAHGSLASMAAQVVNATPVKAKTPRTSVASAQSVQVTVKGGQYNPKNGKKPNADSWALIKAAAAKSATISDLLALVPTHQDFVRYAVRQQWLAVATA